MKYILYSLIFCLFFLNSYKSYSEDALTMKQQLDRIIEEVRDLNKAVFNKSFDKNFNNSTKENNDSNDIERFTSIDIRIYDLEKDIKNLTLQFEEVLFKLDDLSNEMSSLETKFIENIEKIKIDTNKKNIESNSAETFNNNSVNEENSLGKLVLSDNNQVSSEFDSKTLTEVNDKQEMDFSNLTPEDQLQFALDQMVKKNYNKSKIILEDFIINFPTDQLSGSAHYWLGKIHLFQSNYRKAAIVFGEGVQKFPKSIKAAEMYYELAKSLEKMEKIPEACNTLSLLEENYKGNKFSNDSKKIKEKLSCETSNL